ncbi:protein sym-1-like [Rutidosis leptorrhynchoides]|uniref:protein sym-1-like n=1 Tax=Rutidosis leptorrhynchoides TaxID=125765 RepID=UPI003A991FA5
MLKIWKWYRTCLAIHPVKTQVISCGFIWGLGDLLAQAVTRHSARNFLLTPQDEDRDLHINWRRIVTISLFGMAFVGPIGHFWYIGLDRFLKYRLEYPPRSMRFVAMKVVLDGIIFGPIDLFVFFAYMGFASGKNVSQVKEEVKRDFLPALVVEVGIWPIVQVVNFRFVPVKYQLLYVNLFCLLDSCFLSWLEQQQDAAWKQWFKGFTFKHFRRRKCVIDDLNLSQVAN